MGYTRDDAPSAFLMMDENELAEFGEGIQRTKMQIPHLLDTHAPRVRQDAARKREPNRL